MPTNEHGCLAPFKSRGNIQHDAFLFRKKFGYDKALYFPIVEFIEFALPIVDTEFCLEIVEDKDLPGICAETIPEEHTIRVKMSVYEAAKHGQPFARMILAHELGHYYYHDALSVSYAKLEQGQQIPPERNPEKQANVFGAELLAPSGVIQNRKDFDVPRVSKDFGVSRSAAQTQISIAKRALEKKKRKKMARQKAQP